MGWWLDQINQIIISLNIANCSINCGYVYAQIVSEHLKYFNLEKLLSGRYIHLFYDAMSNNDDYDLNLKEIGNVLMLPS